MTSKTNKDDSSGSDNIIAQQAQLKINMKNNEPICRYSKCSIAKPEKVDFYSECFPPEGKFVNIEGPEFVQDYSYFLCAISKPIRDLEKGIPIFA